MASLALVQSVADDASEAVDAKNVNANLGASQRAELLQIIRTNSFKRGDFVLSSGERSNVYFNMKPTMMDAQGAYLAALALLDIMERVDAEYVSGLEMGAVPAIGSMAAVSYSNGKSIKTTFVRKKPKGHGTNQLIEGLAPGDDLVGKKVIVIDDVSTSGKSILQAIEAVRDAGGIVEHAACLVNRSEGGDQLLSEHNVMLHYVFSADEVAQ